MVHSGSWQRAKKKVIIGKLHEDDDSNEEDQICYLALKHQLPTDFRIFVHFEVTLNVDQINRQLNIYYLFIAVKTWTFH